ncbi:MAG TPA: LamG-like jellyroll fold domain-containing protein [Anaerolineales bacterium]|nr:LamG-like jellyroll fold domain-containing protein [Anaerolineales bacterium]
MKFNKSTSKNEWVPVPDTTDTTPLVNETLLVDRFLLAGTTLTTKMEVRYQRSRSKTRPASRKDSLGAKDLDDNFFYEPTQELRFISNLTSGRFSALLLPTTIAEIQRWQIFAEDNLTHKMDSYNVERSEDGLFNTRGSQTYTCVKHSQVYSRRPGTCSESEGGSECGRTLIPRIVTTGYSESSLKFDGVRAFVSIEDNAKLNFEDAITVEAWIKPDEPKNTASIVSNQDGTGRDYSLGVDEDGLITFSANVNGNWLSAKSNLALQPDTWVHLAGSFDGQTLHIFVNGKADGKKEAEGKLSVSAKSLLFAKSAGTTPTHFAGTIDEVRLWKRARSEYEIQADMHQRLTGLESDLVGYWRFDEGSGGTARDQSNNQLDGTITGADWIPSDAPVGEHPGIERTSFSIKDRTLESPPTSMLYYQQSKAPGGYSGEEKYVKNAGRVMLAVATNDGSTENTDKNHIAALDFGVSPSGRLAQLPDIVDLPMVASDEVLAELSANEIVAKLESEKNEDKKKRLEEILKRGASVTMPRVQTDHLGLKISGGVLGFAWTQEAPFLFDSATGTLALYFHGGNDQFFVAYYDTFTERARITLLSDGREAVNCFTTSAAYDRVTMQIEDMDGEQNDSLCTIKIKYLDAEGNAIISETWEKAPRNPVEFSKVLNGQATGHTYIGTGRKTDDGITLSPPGAQLEIKNGATLMAGNERIEASEQIVKDDLLIHYEGTLESTETLPIFLLEYDYPTNAVCEGFDADLMDGSVLVRAVPAENGGNISNTQREGGDLVVPLVCKWTAAAPGSTVSFDGMSQYVEKPASSNLKNIDAEGDLTLEAWVKPGQFGGEASVIRHHSAGSNYMLGLRRLSTMVFDGVDDYVEIRNADQFNFGKDQDFTVEAWVKVSHHQSDLNGDNNEIIEKWSGSSDDGYPFRLRYMNQRGNIIAERYDGSNKPILSSTKGFNDGLFHHVAFVKEGATLTLYIDGEFDVKGSDTTKSLTTNNSALYLGRSGGETPRWFTGEMDEVRVWKRARSQQEIQAAMQHALSGEEIDLVGYWRFESGVANDYSSFQHNGIVHGNPELGGLKSALVLDGREDHVKVPNNDSINFALDQAFTVEAWIKASVWKGRSWQGVVVGNDFWEGNNVKQGYALRTGADGKLSFVVAVDSQNKVEWVEAISEGVMEVESWNHIAGTYDGEMVRVYVNGEEIARKEGAGSVSPISNDNQLNIGRSPNDAQRLFAGAIDEVRIWRRARSQQEIQTSMNLRLSGGETDLVGYWHFEEGQANDYSGSRNNGEIIGQPTLELSPLPAYKVVAGVSDNIVCDKGFVLVNTWAHIAAAYHQAYGLQFDSGDDLDCGNDDTLDIDQDLTIEVFLKIETLNRQQVIIRRGSFEDPDSDDNVPYSLWINESSQLVFDFEDVNKGYHAFRSSSLTAGFHKISAVRKREKKKDDVKDSDGKIVGVKVTTWDKITFYFNGQEWGSHKYETTQPESDDFRQPIDIGSNSKSVKIGQFFEGVITEVRIWNTARAKADIGKKLTGNEKGLVSWWRFEEGKGNKAFDSKSRNHATINGAKWVNSPDPQGSTFNLYLNGQPQATDLSMGKMAETWKASTDQFTLGARKLEGGHDKYFPGNLEEVRIWGTTRTKEQIQDNLFRRILGEKEDLIAYYTFDAETEDQISDYSLRGNHLNLSSGAAHVLSTAPVGDDTPQVRSALAGIRTPFSGKVGSTPVVQEYADMQQDNQGNLIGVFKRCYSYIQDGKWQIITGYKVGDMVTEWIGQVQFAPQLIGFIEGAPPVPSENMTAHSADGSGEVGDYNEASSVELVEADETAYTYAASRDKGFDISVDTSIGVGPTSEIYAGLGVMTKAFGLDWSIGAKASFEHSLGWLQDASTSISHTTGKSTIMALRGRLTTPEEASSQEQFGNRFQPDNVGLALVKSETADVFALRLKHNGALISFQMRPNPDIPKDWNIIHFPINPRYTKQGTLDGKIGLKPDVDYPNALDYSPDSSYFKPIEAYAMKNRINRVETQLRTYFEQYAAGEIGRRQAATHFLEKDLAAGRMLEKLPNLHKRNLINTYVWTADGGLFAETQETMDSQQEMIGGSYAFTGMAGLYIDFNTAGPGIGMAFTLDALFGGHLNLTVTKTQESTSSFGMNVSLDNIERDIYQRDGDGEIELDTSDPKRPMPIKQPGKVDAYRFMSFYLEPLSDHFDDFFNLIVDPIWVEQSDDPAAIALRGARDDNKEKKPAPWRIMHRVTYVSRILPPLDLSAPPSLEKTLQTLDIDSNYELIKLLDPYIRDHRTNYAKFSSEVDRVLKAYMPELYPHNREIKQYLGQYFGMDETIATPDAEGMGEVPGFEGSRNRPPQVTAGEYTDALELAGESVIQKLDNAAVVDDRLTEDDLFLTWEFLPNDDQKKEDAVFDNTHTLRPNATFKKKGQYRLKLSASDGFLTSDKETMLVVDQTPVVKMRSGQPVRKVRSDQLTWDVVLTCEIQSGLGDPSNYSSKLSAEWYVESGSEEAISLGKPEEEIWSQDADNTDLIYLTKNVTITNSGYYSLKCTIKNRNLKGDGVIDLGISARVNAGLVALYTFQGDTGTKVHDVSGLGSPIDLDVASDGSDAKAFVSSAANRLTETIMVSKAITLEAWVKPPATNPEGLGRIITLSDGPLARNFILAQIGDSFHAGLRTTDKAGTDVNASLRCLAGGKVDLGNIMHVVFTRGEDGKAQLYVNGEVTATRHMSGDFSQWNADFNLALGNEINPDGRTDMAWEGKYHLAAIYDRVLTPVEIKQNYEFGSDRDLPPQVSAGEDLDVNWSIPGIKKDGQWRPEDARIDKEGLLVVQLHGLVQHDRPTKGTVRWSKVGGPSDVIFDTADSPLTEAKFSKSGEYKLRLTATDDIKQVVSREITVNIIHETPVVEILVQHDSEDFIVTNERINTLAIRGNEVKLSLEGKFTNSFEKEYPPKKLTTLWSCDSNDVSFTPDDQSVTSATFKENGIYTLALKVENKDDSEKTASASIQITVNQPPVVDAGSDRTVNLFGKRSVITQLDGTVTDDGFPEPPGVVRLKWSVTEKPGGAKEKDVSIMSDSRDITEVQFKRQGEYTFKLEADDGAVTESDTVNVTVINEPQNLPGERKAEVIADGLHVRSDHVVVNKPDNTLYFIGKRKGKHVIVTVIDAWTNSDGTETWVQLKPDESHPQPVQWCAMTIDKNVYIKFVDE